jgi:hypothetical protein
MVVIEPQSMGPRLVLWMGYHSPYSEYMIGANGSVRGKKEFEPSSLAAESEPLLGPHMEDY